jgi:hypothetical protein
VSDRPASRGGTWALVVVLVVAAAASALAAALAGRSPSQRAGVFGPAMDGAPRSSASSGDQVVQPARVVAPSVGAGHKASAEGAPAAAVGPVYDATPAPFRPTRLVLPDGHSAPVSAVGLHADGSLVIPGDPRVVGWWTGGSMAGETSGSVVVAGHVDSASRGIGVLAALPGLRPDQVVELTGGRRTARYRVVSARLVPQAQLSEAGGLFRTDGDARLVLITCGGSFDPVRHRYADNYVVVARPSG